MQQRAAARPFNRTSRARFGPSNMTDGIQIATHEAPCGCLVRPCTGVYRRFAEIINPCSAQPLGRHAHTAGVIINPLSLVPLQPPLPLDMAAAAQDATP